MSDLELFHFRGFKRLAPYLEAPPEVQKEFITERVQHFRVCARCQRLLAESTTVLVQCEECSITAMHGSCWEEKKSALQELWSTVLYLDARTLNWKEGHGS